MITCLLCQVGDQWKEEMQDLTSKFECRLREAQQRNKDMRVRAEQVKVSVRMEQVNKKFM